MRFMSLPSYLQLESRAPHEPLETCSDYVAGNAMCNAMCNEHAGGRLLSWTLPGLVRWAALGAAFSICAARPRLRG